jgi:gluconolactonase
MYAAPPSAKTEVFCRIPDKYRRKGQLSAERLAAGKGSKQTDVFIEGPSFDRHGNLYLVDIAFGRIFRAAPSGDVDVVAEYDGEPNGLKIHRDGRIFIADHRLGILQLDPETGAVQPIVDRYLTERLKGPNDLFIAKNGDIYFTDQGQSSVNDPSGRVYRIESEDKLVRVLDGIPSPNGLALNPAQRMLYVCVTRTNQIWRAALLPDDTVTRCGVFVQMTGGTGPDGMAVDAAGNLLVAHAGAGFVWKFSPLGIPILRIDSCAGHMTTNVAFGGKDNKQLFITESESGCVLVADMDTAGQPMHSHT